MNSQRSVAAIMVILLLPDASPAAARMQAPIPAESRATRRIRALGAGAEVKVTLHAGRRFQGIIEAFDRRQFSLITRKNRPPELLRFEAVKDVSLVKVTYPDVATRAARVGGAAAEFVGDEVRIKLASGKTLRGRFRQPTAGSSGFIKNKNSEIVAVDYTDVIEIRSAPPPRKGISRGLIFAATFAGVFALAPLLCRGQAGCLP
ncbi:MAG TPA: hypothetical protein VFY29_09100 [Terriglobia bacterium]|nr:hypothetical protein [Terriglobia bacterium]